MGRVPANAARRRASMSSRLHGRGRIGDEHGRRGERERVVRGGQRELLAQQTLGWQPTVALREGLSRTVDWFRSIRIENYRPPTPNY